MIGLHPSACLSLLVVLSTGCDPAPSAPSAAPGIASSAQTSSVPPPVDGSGSSAAVVVPACEQAPPQGPKHGQPAAADLAPSSASVEASLRALHAQHPCSSRLIELGRSHQGRPLWALEVFGETAGAAPSMLLNGVHHGDEPLSAAFVLDAARYLLSRRGRDPQVDRWLAALRVWLLPVLNPDGLEAFVTKRFEGAGLKKPGRKNARDNDGDGRHGPNDGVDLNRNYPFKWGFLGEQGSTRASAIHTYRGPAAASEPEVQAMMALAEQEVFAGAISYHVGGVALLVPYTIEGVHGPEPNEAWGVARDVAARMGRHPDAIAVPPYPVRRNLYAVDGTDQDWHRAQHGTVALLIEGALRGSAAAADQRRRAELVVAVRSSWMALFDRYLEGPVIEGRVVDRQGRPVVAEVHIAGVKLREGESWRSRCRDGGFSRWLDKPGPQRLVVRLPGEEQVLERDLTVSSRTKITIRLEREVSPSPCPGPG